MKKLELPEWAEHVKYVGLGLKEAALEFVQDLGGWKAFTSMAGLACFGTTILCFLVCLVLAFLYVVPVWIVWNLTIPGVFGLAKIGFWQAYGIVLLSMFLVKSPGLGITGSQDKKNS